MWLEELFHSNRLKQHMVTIGINQYLRNCEMYKHRCKLYTSAGKCDDQIHFKAFIEESMVSTSDIFTDNIPMSHGPPMISRNNSARKSLCIFTEVLDVKSKTAVRGVGCAKSKRKSIRAGSMMWSIIPNSKRHTKINEQVKKYLCNFILQHSQVL